MPRYRRRLINRIHFFRSVRADLRFQTIIHLAHRCLIQALKLYRVHHRHRSAVCTKLGLCSCASQMVDEIRKQAMKVQIRLLVDEDSNVDELVVINAVTGQEGLRRTSTSQSSQVYGS